MVVGGLVALLLAANLLKGFLSEKDGRPQQLLPEDAVFSLAFWGPLAALAGIAALGAWWSWQTYRRREKSSAAWMGYGFGFGLLAALLLAALGQMSPQQLDRRWLASSANLICAVQAGIFGMAAFREHQRGSGQGGRSRRGGSRDDAGDGGDE